MMLFTSSSLQKAFDLAGVDVKGIWYFGMDIHELIFNLSIEDKEFEASDIRNHLYDHFNEIQGAIDRSKLSDVIFMVGSKR